VDINLISLNGNVYGLPTSVVREVLDPVPITPLPFSPDYVDGLANIGGSVLVQLDLSVQLEKAIAISVNEGQLIVVDRAGEHIALHVDQALLMVSIADEDIHNVQADHVPDGMDLSLLSGMFQWQGKTVLNLSIEQLGIKDIEQSKEEDGCGGFVATVENETVGETAQKENVNSGLGGYLLVQTGNEQYALSMDNVCFVEDLADITLLPQAPLEVEGMTYTHNSPMLILGLGVLMGKQESSGSKLVVVQHQDFRCALRVDQIHGIQHLTNHDTHDALAKDGELSGYLLDAQGSLIGVLNFDVMLSAKRIETLRRFVVDDHTKSNVKERISTRRLLTFTVGNERCALPLAMVEQVVEHHEVEALPDGGGKHLHGAVQIHGDIFPVVDLRIHMDIEVNNTPFTAYVVAGQEKNRWALVVDRVERVVEIPEIDIESTSTQEQSFVEEIGRIDNGLLSIISLSSLTMGSSQFDKEEEIAGESESECVG